MLQQRAERRRPGGPRRGQRLGERHRRQRARARRIQQAARRLRIAAERRCKSSEAGEPAASGAQAGRRGGVATERETLERLPLHAGIGRLRGQLFQRAARDRDQEKRILDP